MAGLLSIKLQLIAIERNFEHGTGTNVFQAIILDQGHGGLLLVIVKFHHQKFCGPDVEGRSGGVAVVILKLAPGHDAAIIILVL